MQPNQTEVSDKLSGQRFNASVSLRKWLEWRPDIPFCSKPCQAMTMNDNAMAISPRPENLLKKPTLGAHERIITNADDMAFNTRLVQEVNGQSSIKLIIATSE